MSKPDGRTNGSSDARCAAGRLRASVRLCLCAFVLGACEHAQPYGPAAVGPEGPFSPAFPRQLTFNPLGDVQPAWLPGAAGIIYSLSAGGPANVHCLGILPPEGGRPVQTFCHPPTPGGDSTTALWQPAVSGAGLLAYVREVSGVSVTPDTSELVLASLAAPDPGRVLLALPYTAPDSTLQTGLRDLQWLHAGTLVFRGGTVAYSYPPYPWDTTFVPIEIMRLNVGGDSTYPTVVPGTANATSLAVDSEAVMYYTLAGDSRVYRLPEGAASATVWYDFGAAGAPTRISVAGNILVALVDTTVYRVDVGTGSPVAVPLPNPLRVQDLALSPSGTRLVVAGSRPRALPDLWLVQLP